LYWHHQGKQPLVDKLRYNLLSVSKVVDADLDDLFHKSGSKVLDSRGDLVCGAFRIGKVFQDDFSFAQFLSYPVFLPKPSTHRMHDPGLIVPHIRPKVFTDTKIS
jgi:hypothetical protein